MARENSGVDAADHFVRASEMVPIGSGAERETYQEHGSLSFSYDMQEPLAPTWSGFILIMNVLKFF